MKLIIKLRIVIVWLSVLVQYWYWVVSYTTNNNTAKNNNNKARYNPNFTIDYPNSLLNDNLNIGL